jgi:hypothetical protein
LNLNSEYFIGQFYADFFRWNMRAIQRYILTDCAITHGFSLPQIQREESKDERNAFPYFPSSGSY